MKVNPALRLSSLLILFASAIHGQNASNFDLSTNEGVNAARESIAGKPIDARSKRCVRRDPKLPGIILVGDFRFDYGCYLEGAFIGKRYLEGKDKGLSKAALHELGWKTASPQQREVLAQVYYERLDGFCGSAFRKAEGLCRPTVSSAESCDHGEG